MSRHIILLRGINVGGHKKLPMADLRASLTEAGFDDVKTYIQSGNVAVTAPSCTPKQVAAVIKEDFGYDLAVVVKTSRQIKKVIADNPFPELADTPKSLHVFFSNDKPSASLLKTFDAEQFLPDRLETAGGTLYVGYEQGPSTSKLTHAVLERALELSLTARNWSTVLKLAELAAT